MVSNNPTTIEVDDRPIKSFLSKQMGAKFLLTIMEKYGQAVQEELDEDDNELTQAVKVDRTEYAAMIERAMEAKE
jgi:nicotinamide riboside kinase